MKRSSEEANIQAINASINGSCVNDAVQSNEAITDNIPRIVSQEGFYSSNKKLKLKSTVSSISSTASTASATASEEQQQNPFSDKYTNLISESNSCVTFATDEWFARADNLIKDSDPVFIPDLYCPEGEEREMRLFALLYPFTNYIELKQF